MMAADGRIVVARDLFAAWSSGDADAPEPFLHPDAVLYDIVGGEHQGWPAIQAFFAQGIVVWPDLALTPDQYWTNDDGVALSWVMSATVGEAGVGRLGEAALGKQWRSEGMSWLRIVDGKVAREVDYHDRGAVPASLGLA
jgi:ketosteroid isomerase-like protein